jgi:hypothetical protein
MSTATAIAMPSIEIAEINDMKPFVLRDLT